MKKSVDPMETLNLLADLVPALVIVLVVFLSFAILWYFFLSAVMAAISYIS